jgi:glycogen operon protein
VLDDSFLVMFNAYSEALSFTLPDEEYGSEWIPVVDTAAQDLESHALDPSWQIQVQARSIVVLRCPRLTVAPSVPGLTEEATA